MSVALYEPPAYTPLASAVRNFSLPHAGTISIRQHWKEQSTGTGGAVWDAAQVLAEYIDKHHERWKHASTVLELGAGLGYASIVASRCGFRRVLATDGDAALIPMLRSNVARNVLTESDSVTVEVAPLWWGDEAAFATALPSDARPPDLIMASDVIYLGTTAAWSAFLDIIATLCARRRNAYGVATVPASLHWHDGDVSAAGDPLILLSHTRRFADEELHFERLAKRRHFELVTLPPAALPERYRNGRSMLHELRWRSDGRPLGDGPRVRPTDNHASECTSKSES